MLWDQSQRPRQDVAARENRVNGILLPHRETAEKFTFAVRLAGGLLYVEHVLCQQYAAKEISWAKFDFHGLVKCWIKITQGFLSGNFKH